MTPDELAKQIQRLPAQLPLTTAFQKRLIHDAGGTEQHVWYSSQKEHWTGWLSEYDGPGAYGRKIWRDRDAKFVYNHINNAAMLIWLAEASGLPDSTVLEAQQAALDAGPNFARMCAAVRRIIPFADVERALLQGVGARAHSDSPTGATFRHAARVVPS
jgi:hypothetical protein